MLRAIIFDMDGVICDSEPSHMRAFQEVLEDEGIVLLDQDYYDNYLAYDDRGCFREVFKKNNRTLDDSHLKSLVDRKAKYFDETMKTRLMIYPGVEAFVKKAEKQFLLGLASGARRLEVEFVLKKANIRHAFSAIVSADDVSHGKPHPESFQKALATINVMRLNGSPEIQPSECIVIEDSHHGLTAARSAGMKTVAFTTSYAASELKADLIKDSFVGLELSEFESLFQK